MNSTTDVTKLKLAVAMAILRIKPGGVTGSEFAEQLAQKYIASQHHWKKRCRDAEAEILHLRQLLVMRNNQGESQQPDKEQRPLEDEPFSQQLFPSPPPSGSETVTQATAFSNFESESLTHHTKFLHHIISIETGCELSSKMCDNIQYNDVVHDTILHSVQLLRNHIGTGCLWEVQKRCLQCVTSLLEKSSVEFKNSLTTALKDLCEQILGKIVNSKETAIEKLAVQHRWVELLEVFSSSPSLNLVLLISSCKFILTYSDELREVKQQKSLTLNPVKHCNIYYVLKACEICLTSKVAKDVDPDVKKASQTMLEDSLLHLTTSYPLFAHGIWKLCSLL